jgi:hypothetical protein
MFYVGSGAPSIHVSSRRQLPTDHDHDGEPRARSANIRVINRRLGALDHRNDAGL